MKNLQKLKSTVFTALMLTVFTLLTGKLPAQEGAKDVNVDVNMDTDGGAWYGNWWVWIIGLGIFIIIIVAIVSAGKKSD